MKKILSLFLTLVLILSFTSCNFIREIKSVEIDGNKYDTLYLYCFKHDCNTNNKYETNSCKCKGKYSSGYFYSGDKLEAGDYYELRISIFYDTILGGSPITVKINALIETYEISVREKIDTYAITYYTVSDNAPKVEKEELDIPIKNSVVVTKERVTIYYAENNDSN